MSRTVGPVGDEGDDAHRTATVGTLAGGATMRQFGGGFRVGLGRVARSLLPARAR